MHEDSTEEEMRRQQRMKIMKDMTKKIRSRGRMDAENRWWVAELRAKGCEKAWIHTGWEDTMHEGYEWLEHMGKKDDKEKMEEMHQRKVQKMIKRAEGSAGLLHKITKPTMWRRGVKILKKDEEDANLLERCKAERREWSTHWQCNEEIHNMQNKPWRNDELKECEEALPRLKECDLEKAARLHKAKTGVGCDGFHPFPWT